MTTSDYLDRAGLTVGVNQDTIERTREMLQAVASRKIESEEYFPHRLDVLYTYSVPELSPDGSCSLTHTLSPEPYNLEGRLGGRTPRNSESLIRLNRLVDQVHLMTGVEWVGIYQTRSTSTGERLLIKLAYHGAPSRAEFPLNAAFARMSNNSAVGLSGRACIIGDVSLHTCEGNPFYVCDARVESEVCLPLLNEFGETVGIFDAESFSINYFHPAMLAPFIAFALEAPTFLP